MFNSIRHGLFAVLAGFTVFICICYTGLALVIAYVTEDMVVDRLMARAAATLIEQGRLDGASIANGNDLIRAYRDVDALPPPVAAQVKAGRRRAEVFTDGGRHYHLRTLDLDRGGGTASEPVYLVADAGPLLVVAGLVRDVGGILAAVALGLLGLALLLAWLLSRRLVAPLQTLAREVRQVRPGAGAGFSARGRRDEIGYLADRLGTTIEELHAALAREHAFTRDVGHELRTPLTVMRNVLEGSPAHPLAPQDLAQLREGLDELAATVDVLFALARAGHIGDDAFDLRGCIEDALLRQLSVDAVEDERLCLAMPERQMVAGNRHLCTLLINNCVGNALFHGGPGARLALTFTDGTLAIVNSIAPGRMGSTQGFLHGQNLLRRIAAAMRWELRFHAEALAYRVEIVPRLH